MNVIGLYSVQGGENNKVPSYVCVNCVYTELVVVPQTKFRADFSWVPPCFFYRNHRSPAFKFHTLVRYTEEATFMSSLLTYK